MNIGEWLSLAAVLVAALAVTLSTRRAGKQDTTGEVKAFTRLEVMLENVLQEVKSMGKNLDRISAAQATCDTEIALLKQRMDALECERTRPPGAAPVKRTRTTKKEGD